MAVLELRTYIEAFYFAGLTDEHYKIIQRSYVGLEDFGLFSAERKHPAKKWSYGTWLNDWFNLQMHAEKILQFRVPSMDTLVSTSVADLRYYNNHRQRKSHALAKYKNVNLIVTHNIRFSTYNHEACWVEDDIFHALMHVW